MRLFLYTVAFGAGIGFFYDLFRILRKTAPKAATGAVAVYLADIIFWLAATGGFFYFMLNENFGEIRAFAVVGVFLGGVLYFFTISRLIIFVFTGIIDFLKRVVITALKVIFSPFVWVWKKISPPVKNFLRRVRKYATIRFNKIRRGFTIMRKKV